ncbi:20943_t:CDS:2, partial [Gigaspora rosea]
NDIPPQPATSTSISGSTATSLGKPKLDILIDPYVKTYIDESIRASSMLVINSIKQYINSQYDRQRTWNEQLQSNINNINNILSRFAQPGNSGSAASHAPASTDHATSSRHSQHLTGTTEQHSAEKAKQDDESTVHLDQLLRLQSF